MHELIKLAKISIENELGKSNPIDKKKYSEKKGVFVTLYKNDELRGCIGSIYPIKSIYESIIENAKNAAFHDPRFPPLEKHELKNIKIEISLLTIPKKLEYKTTEEILNKLTKKDGVILSKGFNQSTFLPQVWEQLPKPIDFLEHLSLKAGLNKDAWKESEIKTYQVEIIK